MPTVRLRLGANSTSAASDLGDIVPPEPINSDDVFNVSSQRALSEFDIWSLDELRGRDQVYSSLLTSYQSYTEETLAKNPGRQQWFFKIALSVLVISPIQFVVCLVFCLFNMKNISIIAPLLASSVEVFGALMFLPKIIAEYLFNTNETTSINNIISAIQNYDISIRSGIRHTVESRHQDTADK